MPHVNKSSRFNKDIIKRNKKDKEKNCYTLIFVTFPEDERKVVN